MDYSIYWPDIKDFSNYTSPHIQAVIDHGKACQAPFEIRRGEMVCYRDGEFTAEYKEWYTDQSKALEAKNG